MHKLFRKQIDKSRLPSGEIDIDTLGALVSNAYEESERDRRRTDRSISLMVEELDQLNHGLEEEVERRTAQLRESRGELELQNARFNAALENMSHGLVMFDADSRLVICNQRYRDMYSLPPELCAPGTPLRDMMRHRFEKGFLPQEVDEYIEQLVGAIRQGRATTRSVQLGDGRAITMFRQPMKEGGWVTTHEDITERLRAEKRIAHMSRHDALTDLPNRLLLRERLGEALAEVSRGGQLAVHHLDLDGFKTVNDTLGHPIGDSLLKAVADRLRNSVRVGDTIARLGGDEFAIIQTGINGPVEAAVLAKGLCEAVNAPYELRGHAVVADVSIGIALAPADGDDPNELLKNADLALHRAKSGGRGSYHFFEPGMDARMKARRELELELRAAYTNGRFDLHYQPIVDLGSNAVTCCEALLRWPHPARGMIPPAEFIPVAEEIGLIVPLGEWVLRKACEDAATWPDDVKVAVNLSPTQLAGRNLLSLVVGALSASGLPACRLEIEITEEVLIRNTEVTVAMLHKLREIGVRVALDDFGTGYSSLSYLRRFPFDKIKIDRSFITGLPHREPAAIVRAITGLARTLNMTTTAEGIETREQLDQIRALGCNEMQGFLFARPMPLEDLVRRHWPAGGADLSAAGAA